MDLDDLLDGVDLNSIPSKKGAADLDSILNDAADKVLPAAEGTDIAEVKLKINVVSTEIKPWLAASANVPRDIRERWTKMAKIDTDADMPSKFQPSYAYRSWEPTSASSMSAAAAAVSAVTQHGGGGGSGTASTGAGDKQATAAGSGLKRCMQEIIKKSASDCKFDDIKAAKLAALFNPVTNPDSGKQLQELYRKQIVADNLKDIISDPNYEEARFPHLASIVKSAKK